MSIIIKEMDMPKEGESIIMILEHSGKVISRLLSDGGAKAKALEDTKAILIPTPHGRLIAEGSVLDQVENAYQMYNFYGADLQKIKRYFANAPTILEAEE